MLILLRVTLLFGAALLVDRLLRRQSAARRRLLWVATFGAALSLPVMAGLTPWQWSPELTLPGPLAGLLEAPDEAAVPRVPELNGYPVPVLRAGEDTDLVVPAEPRVSWLLLTWFAGTVLVGGAILTGLARAASWRTTGRPPRGAGLREALRRHRARGGARVRITERVDSPLTLGIVRPEILLPVEAEEWCGERLEAVLLHEQAHVRHHDVPTQLVARLACAVYWFHPLVWMGWTRLQRETERVCDDAVLEGGMRPSAYAGHLLALVADAPGGVGPAAMVSMARPGEFEGRLLAILDAARDRRGAGRLAGAVLVAVVLLGGGTLAAMTPVLGAAREHDTPHADPTVVTGALASLLDDPDPGVRASAVKALGERRGDVAPLLIGALRDPVELVRRKAASTLGRLDDTRGVRPLVAAALGDPERDVRKAATLALGRSREPAAVEALVEILDRSGDRKVRLAAVGALGRTGAGGAVAALEPLLSGSDRRLRHEAADALGEVGGQPAQLALVRALANDDPEVRSRAARGLGEGQR